MRAALMLLGIPYHVAMAYRANDVWIANAGEGDLAFTWLAAIIHLFRMPAFFIIAGYFASLLLSRRSPMEWLKSRFVRLGLPFLACLLTLNPLLNLFCEMSNYHIWRALASWERNSLVSGGYWVRHLWFIIVLLYLSGAAALLYHVAPKLAQANMSERVDRWLARNTTMAVLIVGIALGLWEAGAIELFYIAGLATNGPQELLRLDQLIEFAPWFVAGWIVARSPHFRSALYRPSAILGVVALMSATAYLLFSKDVHPMSERFIATVAAITMTQALLAGFKHFADRPHPAVKAIVASSFVIYLVHLPIIAGLVVLGQHIAMPVVLKGTIIMVLTAAMSWGAWLVVRRSPTLRLLYDGIPPEQEGREASSHGFTHGRRYQTR